jgi:hypothetical protein
MGKGLGEGGEEGGGRGYAAEFEGAQGGAGDRRKEWFA